MDTIVKISSNSQCQKVPEGARLRPTTFLDLETKKQLYENYLKVSQWRKGCKERFEPAKMFF